jgi:hypothetical protein
MSTSFKLTGPNTITRLIQFSSQPDWQALSVGVQDLFGVPSGRVGLISEMGTLYKAVYNLETSFNT